MIKCTLLTTSKAIVVKDETEALKLIPELLKDKNNLADDIYLIVDSREKNKCAREISKFNQEANAFELVDFILI